MATPRTLEAGVLERCHRVHAEAFWQNLRLITGAARLDLPDATLLRCDLPFSFGNIAFYTSPSSAPRERLLEAFAFFGPKRAWKLVTSGDRASEVGREAARLGLEPGANEPGMVLDPIPEVPKPPTSLTIVPVSDGASFSDFAAVWSEVFRAPRWSLPVTLPGVPPDDPERNARNRFFVGYVNERPVACSTVTVALGVAGISSVGTLPSARRQGFGTALTWAAVDAGRSLGADVACLAASSMGYPVYARMGFRRSADYPSWQIPVGSFRALRALWTVRRLARRQRLLSDRPTSKGPAME